MQKPSISKYYIISIFTISLLLVGYIIFHAEVAKSSPSKIITLEVGKAKTIDLYRDIADVLVANPAVADVGVLKTNRLYLVGQTIGDTNILTFDENGNQLAEIQVHVKMNQKTLQKTINNFFPEEKIKIRTVGNDIVLSGQVTSASIANQVRDLTSRFVIEEGQTVVDLMNIDSERQVLLRVKILEINRDVLNELGISADYKSAKLNSTSAGARLDSVFGVGLTAATSPFGTGTITLEDSQGFGPLSLTLAGLERDGYVNTLAEPNLTALSGEQAGFLAGGEFPVPVSRDRDGNVIIEFHQFGVSLNFRPVVLDNDRISMQLTTEVSSIAQQNGLSLAGIEIPGFQVRRAETTVEIGSGGSLMIAGLLQSDVTNALNKLPGAGDLPILGELFKSKSFARNETELLIIISPLLVQPFKEAQADIVKNVEKNFKRGPLEKVFLSNIATIYGRENIPTNIIKNKHIGYMID